jgi:hypothetical protein
VIHTATRACRACGAGALESVLDLGEHAISDFVRDPTAILPHAPLHLVRCAVCRLVQLSATVDRGWLFRRYHYKSGTNESMVAALANVADDAVSQVTLVKGDHVLDIGANDQTLLRFVRTDVRKIAVDPSNVAAASVNNETTTIRDSFPFTYPIPLVPMKIIWSIAMLYAVDDLPAFVEGIRTWLHPDGVWMIQVSYLPATLATNNVGDIVHEHVSFFSVRPLSRLVRRHGLKITRLRYNEVNGGSVRISVRHLDHPDEPAEIPDDDVAPATVKAFGQRVSRLGSATRYLLENIRGHGELCAGLGASTKGNSMLSVYRIGPDLLPVIADRNPDKHGLFTVGGIPIESEEAVRAMRPDYGLIVPFHFATGIIEREKAWFKHFVVPLPEIQILPHVPATLSHAV